MNLKKVGATMISMLMATGIFTYMPSSNNDIDTLTQLKGLNITPFNGIQVNAESNFRRPLSEKQPMWIVHIDSWNYADPEKIIDLIPEDVLPYVVFNISLSINWDSTNHQWLMVQDGYETAKSWLRTCADKGVWTMIQPSSGGQSHFPDYSSANYDLDNTIYGEFFRDYPNFIGYNYCEQFWGFESEDFPITCKERYQHFANLLKLCNKYGGYLDISWCGNQWSPTINPLAMLKQVPEWEEACRKYSDNYILEEKYTQGSYIADMESLVYGTYISGYCGNFGVRYDETGWTDWSSDGTPLASKEQYRVSTGLPILMERMVKNGMTVIDGPELVWADDFKELWSSTDGEGYTTRKWEMYDQFQNDILDVFRKVIDGTIRIPSREEVIENTKVAIIQDVATGKTWDEPYSTYPSLFEGLYRMDKDGNLKENTNLYKSTGRYQTIPTVYALNDDLAKSIPVQIKQSEISSRWGTIEDKQNEFNKLYQSDYWGNCYAGRNENSWVTYNPNKNGTLAGGYLSLKYNTCKEVEVTYSEYATGLINEYSDHLDIYLNNYDEDASTTLKTNTIKVYGATSEPTFTYKDRGVNQAKSSVSGSWSDGVYTLTVKHNGPIDITINCSGNEKDRLTSYKTSTLIEPEFPDFYTGIRQYESEFFDYKNIEENVTNGCKSGITGYQGQGFMKFGTKSTASVKDTVNTTKSGTFNLSLRYSTTSDINNVDLYVNDTKVKTLSLEKGSSLSDWKTISQEINLKEGANKIELKATSDLASTLYLDNFTVEGDFGDVIEREIQPDENGYYFHDTFESLDFNWSARGSNIIGLSRRTPYMGDNALLVSERTASWNGAEKSLENLGFKAGNTYCFSACVEYLDGEVSEKFALTLQYTDADGKTQYSNIDTKTAVKGNYVQLYNPSYTIPEDATNIKLVVETSSQTMNFYIDEVIGAVEGTIIDGPKEIEIPSANSNLGDVNLDGNINVLDVCALKNGLMYDFSNENSKLNADTNQDGKVSNIDLLLLKKYIFGIINEFEKNISIDIIDDTMEDYMTKVQSNIIEIEPTDATSELDGVQYGTFQKITYYSETCNRNRNANVLLPANYSEDKEYPILYVLHGYWGNENSLLDEGDPSLKLRQIIGNAISQGEAEEMIVVFPYLYASATQDTLSGFNEETNKAYDNFINDLINDLMPYMNENFSIAQGRDNTAITGFSMGGRETLYIGFSRPDLFNYVGAMCPAPGVVPDLFSESEFKFNDVKPKLLMISAGSNDTVVYSTPSSYHDILTNNDVTHVWHYVNGGDHGGITIRPHIYNFVRAIFKD